MRSSCDASATNRRSLRSDASRARNAVSICDEHRVERDPEPADLGALILVRDAVRQVAARDRRRGRADLGQRAQPDPDHPEPEQRDPGEHGERGEQLDEHQAVQRAVDARERGGDEQHEAVVAGLVDARTR